MNAYGPAEDKNIKYSIQSTIKNFSKNNLTDQSIELFSTLGYKTTRQNPFARKTYQEFQEYFGSNVKDKKFSETKALIKEWQYVDLLFQLTKDEITDQQNLFSVEKVRWEGQDKETVIETYLFFAIELKNRDYPRGILAQITREINKLFPMPVMLIFKYGDFLTLSIINRRISKKDSQKDVLEKVTLIKDISINNSHRAHLEILFDLSFDELLRKHHFSNFVELHNAWQNTLDITELNKRFYRELSNWYFWAKEKVSFPNDITDVNDDTAYNPVSVIRLITRLIFIWFIKEKGLIPEKIFDEKELSHLIKDFRKPDSKIYYRAILQNLFFATLNQQIGDRKFANNNGYLTNRVDYGIKNLYRYEDEFLIAKEDVIALFKDVPFLNGGLFDCLDYTDHNGKVIYLDGFSRNPRKQAQVPDELFFSPEETIDLSHIYSDRKKSSEKVKGLFHIFNNYKFTVTENTPIEEEVALDPELLGRAFENLLASYNPETDTTARKQTGSFYTPREIVDFMVNESLKAYLKQKLETEASLKPEDAEYGLEILLEYTERDHLFDSQETKVLIQAIDNCKIIDPACGSGAFPMGILHKLVFILQKLDPVNKIWREIQLEKVMKETEEVFQIGDKKDREERLKEINNTFDQNINNPDYARKLFLIENCIYGVDIQPIAIQISKLRFFISLIVDQKPVMGRDNFGILPLPNLELKFVSANTLVGIVKPEAQGVLLEEPKVKELEQELSKNRHQLFSAKTAQAKRRLQRRDQEIREEMSNILKNSGWINKSARQLVKWDPFDQNASSTFFDPEWMFGIKGGFDIVIGNPPYIDYRQIPKETIIYLNSYKLKEKSTKPNLYIYFIEKGFHLLKNKGILSFINPNQFLVIDSAYGIREILLLQTKILFLVDVSYANVFDASTYPIVWAFIKKNIDKNQDYEIKINKCKSIDLIRETTFTLNRQSLIKEKLEIPITKYYTIISKIEKHHPKLKNMCNMAWGTSLSGYGRQKIKEVEYLKKNIAERALYKPILQTGDIKRYIIDWKKEYIPIAVYSNQKISHFKKPKMLISRLAKKMRVAFDDEKRFVGKVSMLTDYQYNKNYFLALLNSKLINFFYSTKYESTHMAGGYLRYDIPYLQRIPIPEIKQPSYLQIIKIVNLLLIVKKHKHTNIVDFLEMLIDSIVYELYFHEVY